jgi:hypothetical protein
MKSGLKIVFSIYKLRRATCDWKRGRKTLPWLYRVSGSSHKHGFVSHSVTFIRLGVTREKSREYWLWKAAIIVIAVECSLRWTWSLVSRPRKPPVWRENDEGIFALKNWYRVLISRGFQAGRTRSCSGLKRNRCRIMERLQPHVSIE